MRLKFLNLNYRWTTPRGQAGFEGTGYHLGQAYLRAALKVAGFESRQHVQRNPGTLPSLVRDVLKLRPDVVVLNHGPKSAPAIGPLASALKSARPETHIVFSGARRSDLYQILDENPTASACLQEGAEAVAVELVRAMYNQEDPAPSPRLAFRRRGSGEIVAPATPQAGADASDSPLSPYLTGVLPATAAGTIGVEVSRGSSRASSVGIGQHLVHPAERVVEELRWIDQRLPQEQTVKLVGELFAEAGERAKGFCKAMAANRLRYVRPSVLLDCSTADAALVDELASAGCAGFVYRVDARAIGDAEESDLTERVYAIAEAAERSGMEATAHVLFSDPYANPTAIERLVAEVAAVCPNFTYDWPVDHPEALPPQEALYLPEILYSRTLQEHRALEQGATWRFMQMSAGVYRNLPGYAESALDLSWRREGPPALFEGWLTGVLGFDSSLFWERGVLSPETAKPPAPLGEVHTVFARESNATDASYAIDSSSDGFSLRSYAYGRDDVPDEPLVLSADTPEDISKFLEDADLAREKGLFPTALSHPLVVLRDLCRWGGPGQCATPHLPRLFVGSDGAVRPAPVAPPVGRVGDDFPKMLDTARGRAESLRVLRGCDLCPVRAACSGCQCLPEWVSEAEYCSWRQARPWLSLYVSVPAALGRLASIHPELAGADGPERFSVSGFGGPLYYDGPRGGGHQAGPMLLRVGEQHYSFDPQTNRLARLTRDLAAICEALVLAPDVGATVSWLSERWKVTSVAATQAVGTARTQLEAAAMMPYAAGSKAGGEAPLTA